MSEEEAESNDFSDEMKCGGVTGLQLRQFLKIEIYNKNFN